MTSSRRCARALLTSTSCSRDATPRLLPTRPDVIIVRAGPVVVKAHAPGAEREPLVERMRATAHPSLRGIVLEPVTEEVMVVGDRLVTVWPAGTPVNPLNPDAAPWEAAAWLSPPSPTASTTCQPRSRR